MDIDQDQDQDNTNTNTPNQSNRDIAIKEVCEVTACDRDRALRLLQHPNIKWDTTLAINRFFENREDPESNVPSNRQTDNEVQYISDSDSDNPGVTKIAVKKEPTKKPPTSNFATLQSLANDCSSSDEEEGQAFYAGGSERSGQQILGPPRSKKDIVADMFKSVREHGGSALNHDGPSSSGFNSFGGTGYQLGSTPDDTVIIGNKSDNRSKKSEKSEEQESVVLRLWKNGFSLNGGELRQYSDPANEEFLSYIRRGEIPPELRKGSEVYLTMEDLRHEDYKKVHEPLKVFHGEGHMLGSPTPTTVGSTAAVATVDEKEANLRAAQNAMALNESEPVTNIQFRLADGSRLAGRFNHTHTIGNLREFITLAAPVYQLQEFTLQTTFPNKELDDMNQTVKDAGVVNSLVVQRLK